MFCPLWQRNTINTVHNYKLHTCKRIKCSNQQTERAKQQEETSTKKHCQNLLLLSVPLKTKLKANRDAVLHCFTLIQHHNLPIWCSNWQQCSTALPADFLLIKSLWTDQNSSVFHPPPPKLPHPPQAAALRPHKRTWRQSFAEASYLKVVDFFRPGQLDNLLQRGSANQWGELWVG